MTRSPAASDTSSRLMRFLLVSPDIPAEALLADRANFLASSLRRFREAYLFSNEGDEVLRAISTVGQLFHLPDPAAESMAIGSATPRSCPAVSAPTPPGPNLLDILRAGTGRSPSSPEKTTRRRKPAAVARAFTFFDCTDYMDGPAEGNAHRGAQLQAQDPARRIPLWDHLKLLDLFTSRAASTCTAAISTARSRSG